MKYIRKIMLLGSGELGKELVISLKRLGQKVIAVDRYKDAPAMQVADESEVINMLDGDALDRVVQKHKPDIIVPEVEAIRTEKLKSFEAKGTTVIPTAEAAHLTMNRDAIRDLAARELGLKTARYSYATSFEELTKISEVIGFPSVLKPVMSSSGKGQSLVPYARRLKKAWEHAQSGRRGDQDKVILEEYIRFETEITLLTVKQYQGPTIFLPPIGHRQKDGDYRESWTPAKIDPKLLLKAKKMAKLVTDRLGGAGIFGVEFFLTKDEVYFSELSPRPHDTGMVTLISQDLSEFDLHARAMLGLPIPPIRSYGPSASAVILAKGEIDEVKTYSGVAKALEQKDTEVRIFGKNQAHKNRRMGVVLARANSISQARKNANAGAALIQAKG